MDNGVDISFRVQLSKSYLCRLCAYYPEFKQKLLMSSRKWVNSSDKFADTNDLDGATKSYRRLLLLLFKYKKI